MTLEDSPSVETAHRFAETRAAMEASVASGVEIRTQVSICAMVLLHEADDGGRSGQALGRGQPRAF